MSMELVSAVVALEQKANQWKSFGVGAIAICVLLGMLIGLAIIGGGREHS